MKNASSPSPPVCVAPHPGAQASLGRRGIPAVPVALSALLVAAGPTTPDPVLLAAPANTALPSVRSAGAAQVGRRALTTPPAARAPARGIAPGRPRQTVIRLVAAGDVMFGRYQPSGRYSRFGVSHPFEKVAPMVRGHDIALVNLETPLAAKRLVEPYHGLTFRGPPEAARILADAGFTVASTANNHAFDQGDLGVRETFLHLAAAGLGITGTGRTLAEAWAPYLYVKRGVRVAVLGVTLLRNFPARGHRGFWTFVHPRRAQQDLPRRIAALRKTVDFVVLSLHFGVEYYSTIGRYDRTLVQRLVRAGTDVLIGHHPHILRPVIHTGKAILFYSLGNFLFDYEMKGSGQAALGEVELVKRGQHTFIRNVRVTPIYRHWRRIPAPATGRRARRIRRLIRRITHRYKTGTRFRRDGESLIVEPPL